MLLVSLPLGLLSLTGCPEASIEQPEQNTLTIATPDPLKLLVVGNTEIGARLVRQWKAHQEGKLSIENQTRAEWIEAGFQISDGTDLVIYPTLLLGELAEAKKIAKLEYAVWNSDEVDKDSWLSHYRRTLTRYGNEPYAVPLGNPHFAMLYNWAKFRSLGQQASVDSSNESSPENLTSSAELALPETWEQLEEALTELDAKLDLPLAEGWAGHAFVSQIASNVRTRGNFSYLFDRSNMEPLIEQEPFLQALGQLKRLATKRSLKLNPSDVFQLAASGEAVAAMSWPTSKAKFEIMTFDDRLGRSVWTMKKFASMLWGSAGWWRHESLELGMKTPRPTLLNGSAAKESY